MAFEKIKDLGFDIESNYHAEAIFNDVFTKQAEEIEEILKALRIKTSELISGGGGESSITQRLRNQFAEQGWPKHEFTVQKVIDGVPAISQTHEIDHVRRLEGSTIALEIEWNNKDPFFDRDLENFNRLHADAAIDLGVILTRGRSLHDALRELVERYAQRHGLENFQVLSEKGVELTQRQKKIVKNNITNQGVSFESAWAKMFVSDKFGQATTHWDKLKTRIERGVGAPCPWVAIGIPFNAIDED